MPRQTGAAQTFKVHASQERLRPPAELTTAEKKIFVYIVSNNKPQHFQPSDLPLLIAYVHACALELELARKISKDEKALVRWERVCKTMTALSLRLRLSPQSRTPTHTAPRPSSARASQPANYFEQMRLANANGEDEEAMQ
jgi:hypothetical protein